MEGTYSNISYRLHEHVNSHNCMHCRHNRYTAIMGQLLYSVYLLFEDYSSNTTFYSGALQRNILGASSVYKKLPFKTNQTIIDTHVTGTTHSK